MTPDEYLAGIHLELVENPIVATYEAVRQRITSQSGYFRVRISLINGDLLESSEFFRLTPNGIQVSDYRHQWMDRSHTQVIRRWDCAPHHSEIASSPHHCHIGSENTVVESKPYTTREILAEISTLLGH